ncbi:hypothetical protein [Massilia sp. X63]|uniref:hypothetical protein n=2 Tax=Telluria group TaxID=2895353 RepID=UPI0034DD4141
MRFNAIVLALGLVAATTTTFAQTTSNMPAGATPAAPPVAQRAAAAAPAPAAPGVVSLSDMARETPPVPAASISTTSAPEVPAITSVDGTGASINAARDRMRSAGREASKAPTISLTRISRSGDDVSAVLWVQGMQRRVRTGDPVLTYIVGEIRQDGVCVYPAKGKVKDHCKNMLTFIKGI